MCVWGSGGGGGGGGAKGERERFVEWGFKETYTVPHDYETIWSENFFITLPKAENQFRCVCKSQVFLYNKM